MKGEKFMIKLNIIFLGIIVLTLFNLSSVFASIPVTLIENNNASTINHNLLSNLTGCNPITKICYHLNKSQSDFVNESNMYVETMLSDYLLKNGSNAENININSKNLSTTGSGFFEYLYANTVGSLTNRVKDFFFERGYFNQTLNGLFWNTSSDGSRAEINFYVNGSDGTETEADLWEFPAINITDGNITLNSGESLNLNDNATISRDGQNTSIWISPTGNIVVKFG